MASSNINFFKPTPYNSETKTQIWTSIITDSHDQICGCTEPMIHLLSILIPEDHKDRHLTIDQLIKKIYQKQICLFGGEEEKNIGEAASAAPTEKENPTPGEEKEDPFTNIDVEELLAAAEKEEER